MLEVGNKRKRNDDNNDNEEEEDNNNGFQKFVGKIQSSLSTSR